MIQLVLKFFLDYVPAFLGMGNNALGAVLESGGQNTEIARAGEKKKRAVAEKARFPFIELMAWQKFAFEINKMFIVHILLSSDDDRISAVMLPRYCSVPVTSCHELSFYVHAPSDVSCSTHNGLHRCCNT